MISCGAANWVMRPSFKMRARSLMVSASSGSCVTMMVVRLYCSAICMILCLMDSLMTPSSVERSSSSSRTRGLTTRVRARATRYFCPPESCGMRL